jgi:shikimate 5-dehydrogenase
MTHEALMLSKASPQTLERIVVAGGIWMLVTFALVVFLIWRGKRRDAGKAPQRGARARRARRR